MYSKRLFVAFVTCMLVLFSSATYAQNRVVTGTVTDSKDGAPLLGVTVSVKGANAATSTNAQGNYSIVVPATGNVLTFTSVGYISQELEITTDVVNAALILSTSSLENVVVIGYGTVRKKDLTGSISSISSKDFNKGQNTTPEQLIAGKVPGVQVTSNGGAPGSGSTIRIRGGASLNASNDPLIVVDGVPIDNGSLSGASNALASINPNDIETFNILKDASATAIYGSRASNGVIIITTKKGKRGKPVINFNTLFTASKLYKYADVLDADAYRTYVNSHGDAAQIAMMGNANTDWQKEIYRTGIGSDNNLSVSGGMLNGKLPYRVSVGYLTQQGVLKTGSLNRTSAGINLSPSFFNNHLKIDINLKGSKSDSRFANEGAIGAAVNFDPTQAVRSGNNRFNGYYEWLQASSTTGLRALAPRNPVGLLMDREDEGSALRSIGNIQFDYKFHFLPDLRANLNLGYDVAHGYGTIMVNDSAAQDYKRFKDDKEVLHGGRNNEYSQFRTNTVLEFYFNYLKNINKHRIDLTAGYGYYDFLTKNENFADYTYDKVAVSTPNFPFDKPQYTLISYYGRLNYTFNDKYLFTAALRTDGSSKFNPDNRWGLFPSAAFAWKIKEEAFLEDNDVVSDLKLRLGYGITGQQDGIGYYDYISYYALSTTTAMYRLGNNYYQMYRPGAYYYNRKWEQTATYNIGLDYGFADNRINGSIDFYYKKTSDLLNEINQPAGANFSNKIVANVGNMENKGVELVINTVPVRNSSLLWNVNFNATYNKNEITKLDVVENPDYAGVRVGGITGGTGNNIQIHSVGYARSAFYVYQQVYDAKGLPVENVFVDRNSDGQINEDDLYRYKNPDPKLYLGLSSDVAYKQWTVGFASRANFGNYVYNNVVSATGNQYNIINPLGYLNNGSSRVLQTNFQGGGDKQILSDYFMENGSFFRMDNIFVGYDFGRILNNKANLRLNANVQNVFIITKYTGLDPEVSGGIDNNFYPRPRTFGLGLNLTF